MLPIVIEFWESWSTFSFGIRQWNFLSTGFVPAPKIPNYESLLKDINCCYVYAIAVSTVVHGAEILHKVLVQFYFGRGVLSFLWGSLDSNYLYVFRCLWSGPLVEYWKMAVSELKLNIMLSMMFLTHVLHNSFNL
jgi:hypothetical protein